VIALNALMAKHGNFCQQSPTHESSEKADKSNLSAADFLL